MTAKEVDRTLSRLNYEINRIRHTSGCGRNIEIHIGGYIYQNIMSYIVLTINRETANIMKTLMGYPVKINYENPMCLEVHIVESVPIWLEDKEG